MKVKRFKLTSRRRTPTVLQMEAVECGAAALSIILSYYGRYVSLEELRIACGVSRDGSKASSIIKAARGYGMIARGFKKPNLEDLQNIPLPAILFWNFNHFIVLENFGKNKVYINDPASGPRAVSYQEFDFSYTGVVLTFEKGPAFVKSSDKQSIYSALAKRIHGIKGTLIYVVLAGLALVIPGLLIPVFSRVFIDYFMLNRLDNWVKPLLLGMLITAVLRSLVTWIQKYYLLRVENKIALSAAGQFMWHVLRLPIDFFSHRFGGEVSSRININDNVASLLSGELATTAINVIMVLFYGVMMLQYSVSMTMVGLVSIAINILAMKLIMRHRLNQNMRLSIEEGKMIGVEMSGLQCIETIKSMGNELDFFSKWAGYQAKVVNVQQQLSALNLFFSTVPSALEMFSSTAILIIGGWRIMNGEMTVGMLVAFQTLMASFTGPVNQLVNISSLIQELEGSMNRLDDVLRYKIDPRLEEGQLINKQHSMYATKLSGSLQLVNVSFGYSRLDPPFINNFNLILEPGKRIALIGPSGCGKSTLAKLICGLYEPWSGDILFDGRSYSSYSRETLSNSFAYVDQDIFLFEGTLRDNLTLWDGTILEKDIVDAAKDACIHDDIVTRADGYDGIIKEGGGNFSGGQKQRLEIARALVPRPMLLVLDEATAALDPKTEMLIDNNLRRRGCACLIIAHRLSTIRDCDEIIVLDKGEVIQRGTHEDMINVDGPYLQLIRSE